MTTTKKDRMEEYKRTSAYKRLTAEYDLKHFGVWQIKGEDANAALSGTHYMPTLGYVEGYLAEVLAVAVELPKFWQWGAGGELVLIDIKTIEQFKNLGDLIKKRKALQAELDSIDSILKSR